MNLPWNASPDGFVGVLDVLLAITLAIGCTLGLPIYWWLFGTPIVRLWRRWRAKRRDARGQSASRPGRGHRARQVLPLARRQESTA
jgi:hypothetical protein